MGNASNRAGTTILELIVLLGLLSILAGMTIPASVRIRGSLAARAARDAVAADIARARALARLHGSARVRVDSDGDVVRVEAPLDTPVASVSLAALGVDVHVDGGAGETLLEFDALGLGRLANRTIRFRRGGAEAGLTLSSYGRARRW